ncbi:PF04784 family protein [Leptospira inadai serovar Lyme str. 10]|uniref:PF04784 family protein n=2 Tax=Leptospira inadai serovar Lyme TaxID=293084 RepID=V6HT76_9LEPT|nr:DUF547 domain-containing protein [Leptospira inadai]EQA35874.1 PF04784 family protein [Leptospira inadai serovar Lyme str. 10]PNV76954.1 DUF547 domain-containing protein [Leptospira inadai serovar Lyme]
MIFVQRFLPYCILLIVSFLPLSLSAFDHKHADWDTLLKKHVRKGLVDYVAFKKDISSLDTYLKNLSSVTPAEYSKFNESEKLTFLLNAYNAFTVKLILDHFPVKSIKEIGSLLSSPWKREFFELLGERRNLDWIEHEKLRKDFKEPRIHIAINCASVGCPPLLNESFKSDQVKDQLSKISKAFLKDSSRNYYDFPQKTLYLCKIFDWFKEDFTRDGGSLIDFYNKNSGSAIPPETSIKFKEYDWSLNKIP